MFSPTTVLFCCLVLIAVDSSYADVSCGHPQRNPSTGAIVHHRASSCSECSEERSGCNGDCYWDEEQRYGYSVVDEDGYTSSFTATGKCTIKSGGCFPGESLVMLEGGAKKSMKELNIGDVIITVDKGDLVSTKVLGFLEKRINQTTDYLNLHIEDNRNLWISRTHSIFIKEDDDMVKSVLAKEVSPGDMVIIEEGLSRVKQVTTAPMTGAYVPLTDAGTLLVDGVLVSCYTNADHWLAHMFLAPSRWWPSLLLDTAESQHTEGIRTYPWMVKNLGYFLGLAEVSTLVDVTETVDIPVWEVSKPWISQNKMDDEF